jgi:glucose PTS system EIICB or EIICBA component
MVNFKSAFALLQKIGKSLMLPVSVLPVAGILLGVGSAHFGWMPEACSNIMAQAGGAIFGNLPLIFALSVALGLAENDGVAALAGAVGFVVLIATLGVMAQLMNHPTTDIMGMKSIDTGVFGGILIGALAAYLFKKYYRISLPPYLGFFAGKRFVPIVAAFAAIALGALLSVIWPPIQTGIDHLSKFAAYGNPTMAATLYGIVERLLVPFGLHHIWNVPFFFEIGSFTDQTGKVVHGDITRFFAGDPTAGILGGAYLFKMFGLPAAALAIWHTAKPEQRTKVGSIMVSAALTSFLTGITEPIEFSFLFVAPILYLVHALLAGGCQALFGILGAKLGVTFSHGFIDYVLYFSLDTKPWLVLVFGPIVGLIYYSLFRTMILKFDLKTPGRELLDSDDAALSSADLGRAPAPSGSRDRAIAVVAALGGSKNLKSLDACITRLRVELHDPSKLNTPALKKLGASGVMVVGNGVQAIFGPASENLKSDMEEALKAGFPETEIAGHSAPSDASSAASALSFETAPPTGKLSAAKVTEWLAALGGRENLLGAQACAVTRVRVTLKDLRRINEPRLLALGIQAVMPVDEKTVHLIIGVSGVPGTPGAPGAGNTNVSAENCALALS